MNYLIALLSLAVLAPLAEGFGHGRQGPSGCLVSLDPMGNVRIRTFGGTPPQLQEGKLAVKPNPEAKEEPQPVKLMHRFASEVVLTVSFPAVDGYVDGQPVSEERLRELLAKETPALVVEKPLAPELQRAIRKGALILVCPIPLSGYSPVRGPVITN